MKDTRLLHLGADDLLQPLIARQAEDVIDMVCFAPAHQFFAAEAGVGAQHDLHFGPALAQLRHDAAHFFDRARSRILVGRPQPRAQQLVAGEDVQRQIAVAVVVAMEEALRLMAVERDVGGVQVQHDLGGRLACDSMKRSASSRSRAFGRVADLVIAPAAANQLQPVQRALARQRLIQLALAAEQGQQRIGAQLLVVVQVLVAQRQPVDALRQHLRQLVLDQQTAERPSQKQAARRPSRLILRSTSRNSSAPPSLDTWPAVNPASTRREKWAVNANVSWLHSVIRKAASARQQLRSRQRSYAMKRRPFQPFPFDRHRNPKCDREKCGLEAIFLPGVREGSPVPLVTSQSTVARGSISVPQGLQRPANWPPVPSVFYDHPGSVTAGVAGWNSSFLPQNGSDADCAHFCAQAPSEKGTKLAAIDSNFLNCRCL